MRFMTLAPVPLPHKIGSRPPMIAVTVIILGRTRSTAPSITASYRSFNVGLRRSAAAAAVAVFHA